ncbi:cupin domain-containing protein [Nocardia stercoris]|uniref:Cupin domain-containing protein n=1 Tax=Nocardia stercoris TaxID=2483361 RepID=A0A3M2LCA0_9NOCA|nr:cupin domain-containing protein [Nocardia stercoris]RMI35179.1 cupin domain-containing protein [Nocardia stercoris]
MSFRSTRATVLAAAGTLLALVPALAVQPASATPSTGVTAIVLADTTIGDTHYVLREITIAPGGSTGWHYHDGTLYGIVRAGTMNHFDHTCTRDLTGGPGDAIVEPSGPDHVHIEINSTPDPQILDVLYVLPVGSPLSQDAAAPDCTPS